MVTKEKTEKGRAAVRKGKRGEKKVIAIYNKFDFCEVWQQPASGASPNPKYKQDLYIRIRIGKSEWEIKDENKYFNRMSIFRWWDKLIATLHRGYMPVLTLGENYSDILISLRLYDFLGILNELKEQIGDGKE